MKRFLVLIIIVVGWSATAYSKEWEVGPSKAVASIIEAIEMASPHDTICVNEGEYSPTEVMVINKPLSIIACGEVIITAPPKHGIFEIRADFVNISGFHLRNVERSYIKDLAAIWVDYSSDFSITDNTITDCFFAIFCTKAKNGLISNNNIRGNAVEEYSSANAVHLWYCDSMEVHSNTLANHRDGIYLEFTNNSNISGNISKHNLRYGLHFMFSDNDTYTGNSFIDNGAGVAVMFSNNIEMTENKFLENWGRASYGLLLKEIYDSRIKGNSFEKNTIGIFSEGSSRVVFTENEFTENGWAIKMRGSSMNNLLNYNNFMGNSFNIATDAKISHNEYINNFWDDYSGYDLDKDGLGDVPHRPVNLFSYLVSRIDESIILLRSSFIEVLNFTEKVAPAVTPTNLLDEKPLMKPHKIKPS